ncbi:MAG TPA: thiopeptide-type bacteriocin biosynthesis protein [Bryobacteraceae bacterium]|nr:thiopeptide-type bacteriocin biosynthesis protein [Bryobacteraceae bacterium]
MKTIVFLGPTLPVETARQYLDATFLPPVEQGDVLRALKQKPRAIGIIDGYYQSVPSVWHKEILTALAEGVYVAGASSMGALRAAELADFGMVGIGDVFQRFRSGEYTDDDEVAIVHASAEQGYRALSEAMVDIRDLCARAIRTGGIAPDEADGLVRIAKAMHFSQRHWEAILAGARAEGMADHVAMRIEALRVSTPHGAKERDAITLLQHLASPDLKSQRHEPARLKVEQTVFLSDLKQQVRRESAPEPEQAPGTDLNVARKKVLLGMLANREAVRRGLIIGSEDVKEMTDWFRGTYSLADEDRFADWAATHALEEHEFDYAMRRFTGVVRVEEAAGTDIDRELDTYLKVYSAASENHDDAPSWIQLNISLGRGACDAESSARALFGELLPLIARWRKSGVVRRIHFVRKTPDIRLRCEAVAPDRHLFPQLGRLFERLYAAGIVAAAFRSVYEPETRIFGGPEAMDAAHEYFHYDSIQWMAWDQFRTREQRVSPEQLATAVMNDLFEKALGCGGEVWDVWRNLGDMTRTARPLSEHLVIECQSLPELMPDASPSMQVVLKRYARANRLLADCLNHIRERGRLQVGLRSLLPMIAMFHCNRLGLDGPKQYAIAERAAAAWNPHRNLMPHDQREPRLATSGPDREPASRSAVHRAAG